VYTQQVGETKIFQPSTIFKVNKIRLCNPAAHLGCHNQYKYFQLAEKYKLSVKLPFGIVSLVLAV